MSVADLAYARFLDVSGALLLLVALAMLLERALAIIFEYHWFQILAQKIEGLKTPIALLVSWFTCQHVQFDVLSRLFPPANGVPEPTAIGIIITAAVVAGGSAAAITLFQGVLNVGRDARTSLIEANKAKSEADLAEEKSRKDKAEAEAAEAKAKKDKAEAEAEAAKAITKKKKADAGD
ncbi:hypothetical protein [Nitrosomonas ureae]|uniref:Uncharacterized protein n=1 Tax=Nitrosomonas ureae TaxID=44577 RepID=A0A1H9ABB6_9PROT|nr:hypothetical protein [Nitrosomonas ureae]SEP73723.1 hypothetical protein SAMN05421510_100334 [Nitrosomonas ureae]